MFVKCPECGNEFFQEKIDEGSLKYVYCEKCETFIDFCGKCDEMLISKIEGMCAGQYCLKWVCIPTKIFLLFLRIIRHLKLNQMSLYTFLSMARC